MLTAMAEDEDLDGNGEEGRYIVESILSEGIIQDADGTEELKYLVKWLTYGLHECTWEPKEHFDNSTLLDDWETEKEKQGPEAFEKWMLENEKKYERAVRLYDEEQEEEGAVRSASGDDQQGSDDEDEDASRRPTNSQSDQRGASLTQSLERREAIDASQLNSLFVDSQDGASADLTSKGPKDGGLFFKDSPNRRRLPLQQSVSPLSSSEEEAEEAGLSDDSLMGELEQGAKTTSRKSITERPPNTGRGAPRKPTELPRSPAKKTTSISNAIRVANKDERKAALKKDPPSRPSNVGNSSASARGEIRPKSKAIRSVNKYSQSANSTSLSTNSIQRGANSNAGISQITGRPVGASSVITGVPRFMQINQPIASTMSAQGSSSGTKAPAIKFVNQPKVKPRQWKDGENPFKTLHARNTAFKRGRIEGTPELGALEFLGGTPQGLRRARAQETNEDPYGRRETRPRRAEGDPMDNPYGRRETRPYRVEEHPMEEDDHLRQGLMDRTEALKDWEVNKIPLVCPEWRLSNNCVFGARNCRYMHRDNDPDGREYAVGDVSGWIPPKYRTPAITCPFWLGLWGVAGCDKTDNECKYAHHNTGYAPQKNSKEVIINIDPNLKPKFNVRRPSQPEVTQYKSRQPRSAEGLTCWYWANNNRCRYKAEDCNFQHYDTGTTADPPRHVYHPYPKDFRNVPDSRHGGSDLNRLPLRNEREELNVREVVEVSVKDEGVVPSPHTPTERQQSPLLPPPPPPLATRQCSQMNKIIEKVCKLDFTEMFTSNASDNELLDKRAFLMYHPTEHLEELELITRWLMMHDVEVGSPWYDGSWDYFKQQILNGGTGIIIAHPDFELFTELPDFGKVLQKQVRLFSIGMQPDSEHDVGALGSLAGIRHDRVEKFPLGGFIYITEDVFEKQPRLALKIMRVFFVKIKKLRQFEFPVRSDHKVNDAPLFWRLCVRPELMEYLYQHCEKHGRELEVGDPDVKSRAELYVLLNNTGYIEMDKPTHPISLIQDYYPVISERRILAETLPVEYFNTLERSQEDANLSMIRYFAGLQVDLRNEYRYFYVVHTEPEAPCVQRWKQEIQTLSVVMSPEQCLRELMKDGNESLIDFCERHMPVRTSTKEK